MKDRIKQLRKSLKLTQTEFAKKLGVDTSTVTNYELGKRNVSSAVFQSICREFHVREEWLRTGAEPMWEKTTDDLIEKVAKDHNLGASGTAFLRVIVKALEALGPEAMDEFFEVTIPQMRREAHDLFGSTTAKLSEQASASDDHDSRQESTQ